MTSSTPEPASPTPACWDRLLELAHERRASSAGSAARLTAAGNLPGAALYRPLLAGDAPFSIAHLGQSLDGCIATASGHAFFVTGKENLTHLHRLRALSDAVLVGAATVAADDPRLTVRRVTGPSPVPVVLDRRASLRASLGLFARDRPDTVVVTGSGRRTTVVPADRQVEVPEADGRLVPQAVRDALARRGLTHLFLEGGGVTVSDWLQAGALDRLHVAVAPVIVGDGRRGLSGPSVDRMSDARRPPATHHAMGEDVLFDLDLAAQALSA